MLTHATHFNSLLCSAPCRDCRPARDVGTHTERKNKTLIGFVHWQFKKMFYSNLLCCCVLTERDRKRQTALLQIFCFEQKADGSFIFLGGRLVSLPVHSCLMWDTYRHMQHIWQMVICINIHASKMWWVLVLLQHSWQNYSGYLVKTWLNVIEPAFKQKTHTPFWVSCCHPVQGIGVPGIGHSFYTFFLF